MKKYLLLLILLFAPVVSANMAVQLDIYNIYLDEELLDNFSLSRVICQDNYDVYDYDPYLNIMGHNPNFILNYIIIANNTQENCTWVIYKNPDCRANPCLLPDSHISKWYLETDGKTIVTEELVNKKNGEFNFFIQSDGSIELEVVNEKKSGNRLDDILTISVILLLWIPLILLNAGIEVGVAAIYFRKISVPKKRLWWVLLANVITYIPFMILMFMISGSLVPIIIAEIAIMAVEALFYKWRIQELDWKRSFILSVIANATTIFLGLLISLPFL